MTRLHIALVLALVLIDPQPSPAQNAKPAAKPKVADWQPQQQVEVKWGGQYRKAAIVNRRGEWYLIQYSPGTFREWVEHWRIRKAGDKEDSIGYAAPNPLWKTGDNPPRESAGDPPPPHGAAGARQDHEKPKAIEEFKKDPAYKEADWATAKQLELRAAAGDFKLTPDPAHRSANVRPVKLSGASKEFFDKMKTLVIARPSGGFAALIHENAPPGGKPAQVRLERLDLANGKSTGVYELKEKMALLDITNDGKLIALRNDEVGFGNNTRLEILAFEGAQPRRILLNFPYEKESFAPEKDISSAWLIDAAHALTINSGGKLVMWDLATGNALYRAALAPSSKPAISPGGKQMAVQTKEAVLIFEPLTGNVLASLPFEGRSGLNLSFSPSGKQLAGSRGSDIYVWDLTTGKLYREFSLAIGGGDLQMVADGYALADDSILIDFERRIPLWQYIADASSIRAVAPSGILYHSQKASSGEPTPLTPAKVPTPDALALAQKLKLDELLLLKPGVKVAVAANVDAPEADRRAILDSMKKQLADNQLVIDDTATIRITAASEPGKTTEREYRTIGAGASGGTQKVSVTELISKVTIEVDGKKAWETQSVASAGAFMTLKEGQTIEQAIAEACRPNPTFLKNVRLPAYLTKPKEPAWYGSSRIEAAR